MIDLRNFKDGDRFDTLYLVDYDRYGDGEKLFRVVPMHGAKLIINDEPYYLTYEFVYGRNKRIIDHVHKRNPVIKNLFTDSSVAIACLKDLRDKEVHSQMRYIELEYEKALKCFR